MNIVCFYQIQNMNEGDRLSSIPETFLDLENFFYNC